MGKVYRSYSEALQTVYGLETMQGNRYLVAWRHDGWAIVPVQVDGKWLKVSQRKAV